MDATLCLEQINALFKASFERFCVWEEEQREAGTPFLDLRHSSVAVLTLQVADWGTLDLAADFARATEMVQDLGRTNAPVEVPEWTSLLARWLYPVDSGLARHHPEDYRQYNDYRQRERTDRALAGWRGAVARQSAERNGLPACNVGEMDDYSFHSSPSPVEVFELTLLDTVLRHAREIPQVRTAWAASALQQQRLRVFAAMQPDRALMEVILPIIPPPSFHRHTSMGWTGRWEHYCNHAKIDKRCIDWLWQEWAGIGLFQLPTLRAMVEAGINPLSVNDYKETWPCQITDEKVFREILAFADPLHPQRPFQDRLQAFLTLGPAAMLWRHEDLDKTDTPHIIHVCGAHTCADAHWLLPYAKERWMEWSESERSVALDAWKAQSFTGLHSEGKLLNLMRHCAPKWRHWTGAYRQLECWPKQNLPHSRRSDSQLDDELQLGLTPPPRRWVFENTHTCAFLPGLCHARLTSRAREEDGLPGHLYLHPIAPKTSFTLQENVDDCVWHFLWTLSQTHHMAGAAFPCGDGQTGRMIGEALNKVLLEYCSEDTKQGTGRDEEETSWGERAAENLLDLRACGARTLSEEAWQALDDYLPAMAVRALKRNSHFPMRYLLFLSTQPLPETEAKRSQQAQCFLLAMSSYWHEMSPSHPLMEPLFERLKLLWTVSPDAGEPDHSKWDNTFAKYPCLQATRKAARLNRGFPIAHENEGIEAINDSRRL